MKCRMRSSEKPRKKGKVNGLGREMETGAKHASLCFWAPLRANIKVAFNIGSSTDAHKVLGRRDPSSKSA